MADLLTKDQRKGLLYGSLISAGLAAAAASRFGGNVMDAVGAGLAGATSGYAGGLNDIVKLRHAEIERQKAEEMMKAAEETRGLSRERFEYEKRVGAQTQGFQAEEAERKRRGYATEESDMQRLMEWIQTQKAKSVVGEEPALPANVLEMLGVTPRSAIKDVLGKTIATQAKPEKPKEWAPIIVQMPDGSFKKLPSGQPIPPGAKPYSMGGVNYIDVGYAFKQMSKTGEVLGTIPKKVSPTTIYIEDKKKEREKEKPEPKLEPKTWVNFQTLETIKVDPHNRKKVEELMADPNWDTLENALKINPMLKYNMMLKGRASTQPTRPTEGSKKFTIIKVE